MIIKQKKGNKDVGKEFLKQENRKIERWGLTLCTAYTVLCPEVSTELCRFNQA